MIGVRIPVVRLGRNLIVSVQVDMTDDLLSQLKEDIGQAIERADPLGLIIDVSGIEVMDSYITRGLCDLGAIAQLMGVHTVMCGMRPAVAVTLVEMGVGLQNMASALNLDAAMEILRLRTEEDEEGWTLAGPEELIQR